MQDMKFARQKEAAFMNTKTCLVLVYSILSFNLSNCFILVRVAVVSILHLFIFLEIKLKFILKNTVWVEFVKFSAEAGGIGRTFGSSGWDESISIDLDRSDLDWSEYH